MINAIINMIGSVAIITGMLFAVKSYCNHTLQNYGTTVKDQIDTDNVAFSIFRISIFIAIAFSTIATVNGDLLLQVWHGILGLVFIFGAFELSNRILLPNFDDRKAIVIEGNTAVATMMGGFLIATGIIAYSSFVGNGPWWTSFVFFGIGQAILLGMSRVYEWMHPELLTNVKEGKLASGIMLGGMFVAFAFILNGSLAGNYIDLSTDIYRILVSSVVGLGMLLIFVNKVIDNLFIPHINLSQMIASNNTGAIGTIVTIKILLAISIGYVVF